MYQAITAPEVEKICSGYLKRWEQPENIADIGLGQVIERSGGHELTNGTQVCFERWLVRDGEAVFAGQPLAEVMIHGASVQVRSLLDGIIVGLVDWKEGDLITPGEIIANVATRFDQGSKKTGLNPKPSSAMYFARTGHFRVY